MYGKPYRGFESLSLRQKSASAKPNSALTIISRYSECDRRCGAKKTSIQSIENQLAPGRYFFNKTLVVQFFQF